MTRKIHSYRPSVVPLTRPLKRKINTQCAVLALEEYLKKKTRGVQKGKVRGFKKTTWGKNKSYGTPNWMLSTKVTKKPDQ